MNCGSIAASIAPSPLVRKGAIAVAIVTPMTALETDLLREQAYVDGAWVDADSGATFPVVDPATGATIAERAADGRRRDAAGDRGRRSARSRPGSTGRRRTGRGSCAASPT